MTHNRRPSRFCPPGHPVNILLDTDMATDCDDAGALAVLHGFAMKGEARIAAMVVNNRDIASAGAVAAINSYYGRADIPLGIYRGDAVGIEAGPFVHALAADTANCGHIVRTHENTPEAVDVYRHALAGLPDGSAVIVSIGHLNNLALLLDSLPDAHSELDGMELVRRKVAYVVMMAGDYPSGKEHNFFARGSHAVSARTIGLWPTPILFSGFTLGLSLLTGPGLKTLPSRHPVRRAYELHPSQPLEKGRPSWDQTAIVAAVCGPEIFWTISEPGFNRLAADGANTWEPHSDGPHAYLQMRDAPAQVSAAIERWMLAIPSA